MAHQTDEYCIMERVKASVDLYQQVIADWCGV
jgi:acetylornithine deacetylase/succinyl-diaminopimelate desuccinylase-like protein